jgi:hypothetical protein
VKWLALLLLATAACYAEEPKKPRCNGKSEGLFWPEEANTDRIAAGRLSRCGALEVCVLRGWRYKWQPLSVHVSQLGKKSGALPASCLAPTNEAKEQPPQKAAGN